MFIKHVDWLDRETSEAKVLISDGIIDILCFSHPFYGVTGDKLLDHIYCLDAKNIVVANSQQFYMQREESLGYFGYSICGKLIDRKNQIVRLNNIALCLGDTHIPNDISEGSYIEFEVTRLDIS